MIKKSFAVILMAGSFVFSQCQTPSKNSSPDPTPLGMAKKMAESVMKRSPSAWMTDFVKKPKWEYTQGLVCKSFEELWKVTGDQKYFDYEKGYADTLITKDGVIIGYNKDDYNIDQVNSGKILFELYTKTNDPKYKTALETLRDQMRTHPRTYEGGFWHKKRYPNQMWLDGIYMGTPFLAQYSVVFNDKALMDDVANQIITIQKHTYDPKTGLNYHGWDESKQQKWANQVTGQSPNFWGRSMGWYCMGIVDVLDFMPKNHPKYDTLKTIYKNAIDAMIKVQDPASGVWYQVLDKGEKKGNYLESTVSCMMAYSILKGVRMGYLDKSYLQAGKKAYNGILKNFIKENPDSTISLTKGCSVAGLGGDPYRDGSFEYYISEPIRDNDPKGVGPFILSAIEMNMIK
jgi:unsaturated rhamnogalacturonyl hydrolase